MRTKVPSCILALEKYWFLNGFLPLSAIVPPKPGEPGTEQPDAPAADDSDEEAARLLFGSAPAPAAEENRRTWQDLALRVFQPDPQLHAHLEEMIHEMEDHEAEFIDPMHRPWRPRELLMAIENFVKVRCRADMNHCGHCGQMNASEYRLCLRCKSELETDRLEQTIEAGTVEGAMQLEGFRILPSPCIKFFLLCQRQDGDGGWGDEVRETLRALYMLFTRSRFLAGEMVLETTDHHVQAAADLNNLNRHLNMSLSKGKGVVEELQALAEPTVSGLRREWARVADAALEAQQNLCLMIDAWEEFEGVRLNQWWAES